MRVGLCNDSRITLIFFYTEITSNGIQILFYLPSRLKKEKGTDHFEVSHFLSLQYLIYIKLWYHEIREGYEVTGVISFLIRGNILYRMTLAHLDAYHFLAVTSFNTV